jgi:N,N'-diacetylchitobiose phosphorylase
MDTLSPPKPITLDALFESVPPARLLAGATAHSLVTAAGTGFVAAGPLVLTRWRGDATEDADGAFLYLRDLEGGAVWSAGFQPTAASPDRYAAHLREGTLCIEREDAGILSELTVAVHPEMPAELRRLTLTNLSDRPRRLDVTSYAEVVLAPRAADLAHPAFSKLFVETERLEGRAALLARRRPRGADEPVRWMFHALLKDDGEDAEHETDRARFIGRGRTLRSPAALDTGARLSGATGCVLDPVVSLRREVPLEPGASVSLDFALGTLADREAAEPLLDRLAAEGSGVLTHADALAAARREVAGLSEAEAAAYHRQTAARLYRIALPDSETPAAPTLWAGLDGPLVPEARGRTSAPPAEAPYEAGERTSPRSWEGEMPPNGYGAFSEDGTEYVIRVAPGADGRPVLPPLPWTNVVANERIGFVASERGAWHTWAGNSREHRLTPWSNDPVSDPHGEALYVRDEEDGTFWSPTPGPVPASAVYEVRHGFGYTRYVLAHAGIEHELTIYVVPEEPVRLARLRLQNSIGRARRLSVFAYARLVLGGMAEETVPHVDTMWDGEAMWARNPASRAFPEAVTFALAAGPEGASVSATADREAFLGRFGNPETPRALRQPGPLAGEAGHGRDACAAFQVALTLDLGEEAEVLFLLGMGDDEAEARALCSRYVEPSVAAEALMSVRAFWSDLLGTLRIETPEPAIDVLANGWLLYQALACRMWGRTAFYQSGGAYGFRDQLQDALAFLPIRPALVRRQLLLHAAHQFVEGDVLHWWHPPLSEGIRTRFSDDLLWLPYAAAAYVQSTGDRTVLDEEVPFIRARLLEPGEDEAYLRPEMSGETGSLYEHACRSLERSLAVGAHGLPLMGTGDWNDGMNRVGREGRGESVWLGFFLYAILRDFVPLCVQRGDTARTARYAAHAEHLHQALNEAGWDGQWYRRAYYDNGAPLGSAESDECKIDAIAQAWAVLSGAAPLERISRALGALETHLVDGEARIIRLLTPPFDQTPHDPGYIKGYLPGVRENGGQYTHGALWAVRALAEAGRRERAAALLAMLSPVAHTATHEDAERYLAEPYVVAADIYGVAPHTGRGGWTWYTGSAGWMHRVAVESICGLRVVEGETLELRPCLPDTWPGISLRYHLPGEETLYEISIDNPNGCSEALLRAEVDGAPAELYDGAALIPLVHDRRTHHVRVVLGAAPA